jgi:cobalt-zinc-cadmium efflux system membrane fusion protein
MKRFLLGAIVVVAAVASLAAVGAIAIGRGREPPAWLSSVWGGGAGLFCREHGVPEKFCTLCHAELKSTLGMCREHGVPEAVCTVCHPDAEQQYGLTMICAEHRLPKFLCPRCQSVARGEFPSDWCAAHGVPESLCTRCQPDLATALDMCDEHGVPDALCTICRPELAANFTVCKPHYLPARFCARCDTGGTRNAEGADTANAATEKGSTSLPRVKLPGPDVAAKAGIEVKPATVEPLAETVSANGGVSYDETRLAHVRPRVTGLIREVSVKPGDHVEQGQLLAVIDSAELGQAKADYLAATPLVELWTETLARTRGLSERGLVAEKLILEAETELRRAKAEMIKVTQRLRNLGCTRVEIAALADEPEDERNLLRVTAPLAGTVVRRRAVVGESVGPSDELFAVTDLARVWVQLDVYEKDLRRISVGQPVTLRVPGLASAEFTGSVAWIDTEVNDRTRTIRVRAEVDNRDRLLRAHMFGRGEIHVGEPQSSLVVPRDAVQWEGASYVIFVQRASDEFEPRRVLVGRRTGTHVELAWAKLKPGDLVAAGGSYVLKTEILKEAIGAGCCAAE